MATTHNLRSYGDSLERKIKQLLNSDLKAILKEEGLQVSGVKSTLQERIINHIEDIITTEDAPRFAQLYDLVNRFGAPIRLPGPSIHGSYPTSTLGSQPSRRPSTSGQNVLGSHHSYANGAPNTMMFRKSPFYDVREPLCHPVSLPVMTTGRSTNSAIVQLSQDQATKLKADHSFRIMVYCCADSDPSPRDISFPSQVELKCNNEQFSGSLKGIKKKPGTTKPADITAFLQKQPGVKNTVSLGYAATDRRYQFSVFIVRKASVEELVQKITTGHVISKKTVIDEMISKSKDEDVVATATNMSLKCPLSARRMDLPCRSTICNHNQCFDATSFLQLQEQAPQWTCPICNRNFGFDALVVDQFVQDILESTSDSIDQVTVEPNGVWKLQGTQGNGNKDFIAPSARASSVAVKRKAEVLDIDSGIEVIDHRHPQAHPTPTFSSREPSAAVSSSSRSASKLAAEPIIDLTLSSDDEDDEPPRRPFKRQSTGSYITSTPQPLPSTNLVNTIPQSAPANHSARPTYAAHALSNHRPQFSGGVSLPDARLKGHAPAPPTFGSAYEDIGRQTGWPSHY